MLTVTSLWHFFSIIPFQTEQLSESAIVSAIDRDLRTVLIRPDAPAPNALGVRVWPQAIPQFLIGHVDLLDTARGALHDAGLEGLFLGGNYVAGVALGRCVEGAYESADMISQYFAKSLSK
eukprot:Gb_09332 [translate_table: standard]